MKKNFMFNRNSRTIHFFEGRVKHLIIIIIIMIIYHDFLPLSTRASHVKSDYPFKIMHQLPLGPYANNNNLNSLFHLGQWKSEYQ